MREHAGQGLAALAGRAREAGERGAGAGSGREHAGKELAGVRARDEGAGQGGAALARGIGAPGKESAAVPVAAKVIIGGQSGCRARYGGWNMWCRGPCRGAG